MRAVNKPLILFNIELGSNLKFAWSKVLVYCQCHSTKTAFIASKYLYFTYYIYTDTSLQITQGVYLEVVGPSLPDLRDRIGVNTEEISRALIGSSIGSIFGCLGG